MTIEELKVLISAETSGLKKEISNVKKQMIGLNKSVQKSTVGITRAFRILKTAIIAIGIGKVIKDSIMSGMEAIESENLFEVSLGRMADSARKWSNELQKTLGLNAYEIRKNLGVLYNMTTSMGLTESSAYDLSTSLTKLAYDMASFYNLSPEEAFNKLRAGITGETEPLKRLGILVDENTIKQVAYKNGIAEVGTELTQQQKVMARYIAIMEQTKNAQGDLARTIDSPANQLRILRTQLELLRINLGKAFMPIVQVVLPILTTLAKKLVTVINLIAQFTNALFGVSKIQDKQANTATKTAKSQKQVGNAIEEAGEKAKGSVAGFDEINQLQEQTSDNTDNIEAIEIGGEQLEGGEQLGGTTSNVTEVSLEFNTNIDEMKAKIQEQAEEIKLIVADLKTFVATHSDEIISSIVGIGIAFTTFKIIANWSSIITKLKLIFTGLVTAIGSISLPALLTAVAIGAIVGTIIYLWRTNEGFRNTVVKAWESVKQKAIEVYGKIKTVVIDLWETKLVPFGEWLSNIFRKAWDKVTEAATWLWENVLKPFGDFLLWMYENVIKPVAEILADVLATAFGIVKDVALILWENVLVPLGDFLASIFSPIIEALSAIFTFLWKYVLKPLAIFISGVLKIAFKCLVKVLEFLWKKVLKPLVKFLGGIFIETFETVTDSIKGIIGGLKEIFTGLLNFITGVFTGDWERAWEGVKKIFKGIFDTFYNIVKTPLNLIIGAINKVISGLNSISIKVPRWVPKYGGRKWGINIPKIPKLARGGIIDRPTLAMIGEAGKEAVIPLENTSFVNTLATAVGNAVLAAMQVSNFNNQNSSVIEDKEIILQLDGTKLARIILPKINQELQRMGVKPIIQAT